MKPEHQQKLEELIAAYSAQLAVEAQRLYHFGGIDVDAFPVDEYRLAKVLLTAAIERTMHDYRPFSEDLREQIKNLVAM